MSQAGSAETVHGSVSFPPPPPPQAPVQCSGAEKDDNDGEDDEVEEEGEEEEEQQQQQHSECHHETVDKDSTEHTASNIPVGIAVAQQRADAGRADGRAGVSRSELPLRAAEDPETSQQLAHDFREREEFLRQQKSMLTGAAKPIPNTGLPPNLVVTGGESSLTEDLRLRPLTNQWLAAGHGITASPWLPQNPFALHPAIPTSSSTFDPNHQAGMGLTAGFKLAQDSLTGQLLIIPSGDLVDQSNLWSAFQSAGATTQPLPTAFPPVAVPLSQHGPVTATAATIPTTNADRDEQAPADDSAEVTHSEDTTSVCEEETSEGQQSPEQPQSLAAFSRDRPAPTTAVVSVNNNNVTDSREKGDGVNLNTFVPADLTAAHSLALQAAAAAAAAGITPAPQFPFVISPALFPPLAPPPPAAVSGVSGEAALNIKTETPSVQSRGCSPIVMSPPPHEELEEEEEEEGFPTGKTPSEPPNKKQVSTACISVQTSTSDLEDAAPDDPPPSASHLLKVQRTPCKEQGIQTCLSQHLQPLSVICATPDLRDLQKNSAPLGALAAAALAAEEGKGESAGQAGRREAGTGVGSVSYNPFTDPQILQAADGLELLSTLAEKRPKCSSAALVDPKAVFPSPSDSFKSDTPLPCPELEEASSLGEGERSGGTTPRGDRPRDSSPKWAAPAKKEGVQTSDVKMSSSGLANMDAIELDMRIRLAELQRQYREKQRELAKLQPKKDKEEGVKRGRGRPRKRQLVAGKNDDESSNSSGGKTSKEGAVKRRRPAEELVDRVFRKLPPAKLGKLKSISLKHKRRPSHTVTSSEGDETREGGKKKSKHRHDTGNLFSNLESSFGKSSGKKKLKRQSDIPATITSGPALSHTPTTITPVSLESGLGLLAKFATSALSSSSATATFSGAKRKSDDCSFDGGLGDPPSFGSSPGHSPLNKRRESDTDNSDTANGTGIKKRKPGRPRKCDPNKTTGFTETIWARNTGLLQLSDVAQGKTWVSKAEEAATTSTTTTSTASSTAPSSGVKLAASQASSLAPLLLDEWSLRRSERIFLSDTSPLPSPNLQPVRDSVAAKAPGPRDSRSSSASGPGRPAGAGGRGRPPGTGYKQRQRAQSLLAEKQALASGGDSGTGEVKDKVRDTGPTSASAKGKGKGKEDQRDRDHAKVQKARSLQELTQRVKRKYNKKLSKKSSSSTANGNSGSSGGGGGSGCGGGSLEEKRRRTMKKRKPKVTKEEAKKGRREKKDDDDDSSSEGDNLPLISLKERPATPEPRSCIIRQEELQDGLNVLFFRDCLFYEGQVQAIQPPDIYGVVVTGQRGTRPHICSREEILKDAIMAVAPGSQRYVTEGTRVCAYWSQQFRCLYPGTVAKTSPNPHAQSSVNVEFDDGDSGRIPLSHIRLLPPDFPLVTEEPDPLLYPTKKRRRTVSEEDFRKSMDDRQSLSSGAGTGTARRNSRSQTADDTISDDGSVFDTSSLKSGSGKSSGSRTRACREDAGTKFRRDGKTTKETPRAASSTGKRTAKKASRADRSPSENSDKSEEEESSSEEGEAEASSSSEDERKTSGARGKGRGDKDGKKDDKRDKKKGKDERHGGSVSRLTWRWEGPSTKRPGMRGKAKKEFYKAITRGSDLIHVGDSAVFVSTGRDHCPYIGRIESLWESWGGQMMVRVKWFYHPEETKGGKQLAHPKGALFESPHSDENDVQTISHRCQVLSFKDYNRRCADLARKGQPADANTYYLAGYYDPTIGFMKLEPDVQ